MEKWDKTLVDALRAYDALEARYGRKMPSMMYCRHHPAWAMKSLVPCPACHGLLPGAAAQHVVACMPETRHTLAEANLPPTIPAVNTLAFLLRRESQVVQGVVYIEFWWETASTLVRTDSVVHRTHRPEYNADTCTICGMTGQEMAMLRNLGKQCLPRNFGRANNAAVNTKDLMVEKPINFMGVPIVTDPNLPPGHMAWVPAKFTKEQMEALEKSIKEAEQKIGLLAARAAWDPVKPGAAPEAPRRYDNRTPTSRFAKATHCYLCGMPSHAKGFCPYNPAARRGGRR
jgi:hypothetical protein